MVEHDSDDEARRPADPVEAGDEAVSSELDALGGEVGDLLARLDGPPPAVTAAAKDVFTWRTIDAELAALAFDSIDEELAVTRSAAAVRRVVFEHDDLVVELEVDATAGVVHGQLDPPAPGRVVVESDTGTIEGQVDAYGLFELPVTQGEKFRLRFDVATPFVTSWVTL